MTDEAETDWDSLIAKGWRCTTETDGTVKWCPPADWTAAANLRYVGFTLEESDC